jgi:hypothetical protein
LIIRFGDGEAVGTLHVEVKRTSYEDAGNLDNLPIYAKWLDDQPGCKAKILLVVDATDDVARDQRVTGWNVLTWEYVSLQLRRYAAELCGQPQAGDLLKAALWLCFAGAIEQNLLGLEEPRGPYSPMAPHTAKYLEEFLDATRR